ncbi:MAG: sodium:solute symporter family protein [candidate division KSB1 bacterium]|nr:sodium:solute symporter family protein [candidate division KSB1 bacterium]MDZ7272816.1 sodium:solute symporter family protein [candidate division KSB1 bacterium]MDZ7284160.1 sodium:solute symporter family protein [candidate division KSB1 bacterium]MDZ7297442.1 sodium:solute symporter family protein [candidate division KSB1 bacterium]MDZ7348309.1 sodium:solute symporter family protein [candidate division KSB1 bacterium]
MAAGQLTLPDYIILLLYLLALLLLGFLRSRQSTSTLEEYVIAGRKLSLPAFVATLVATWYGGILGVGEFSYQHGLSNWLVLGVPYYLHAFLFAVFLAGRARRAPVLTIPEQLEASYGRTTGLLGALFVALLATPAPYVLMLGVLCEMIFGWPLWLGVVVGTFFSIVYCMRGGLPAVVRTEILQFILMYAGFILILAFAITRYGAWEFLAQHLPPTHLTWHGGNRPQYILVWYFIAMSTLVDPSFYQRCFAARSEAVARRGIFIAIGCWLLFDFMTTATGLYARALLPDLANPAASYPELALHLLPAVARGIFFVALLATIMSTIDSFAFLSAISLGRDIFGKLGRQTSAAQATRLTQQSMVIVFLAAVAIALWAQSVVAIWYRLGTIITPALLPPLAASFSAKWKMSAPAALSTMVLSAGLTSIWLATEKEGRYWLDLEPIYAGLALAVVIFLGDQIRKRGSGQTRAGQQEGGAA